MLTDDELESLQKTFDGLYVKLNNAYWAASTIEAKDQIHGALDVTNEVLDQLDHAQLTNDNAAIQQLTDSLQSANKDLGDLQKQMDQIVHNVKVAAEVLGAINQTLVAVGKIAGMI